MIVSPAVLIPSQYAPSSATLMYTSSAGITTIIDSLNACNNGSTTTLNLWIVPSGGSAGNSNLLLNALSIAGAATDQIISPSDAGKLAPIVLGPGDSIYMQAASASSIAVQASGRQVTLP